VPEPKAEMSALVAPQPPAVAPEETPAKNKATRAKKATKAATNASVPREGSKTSQVIAMLKREGGVTLKELMTYASHCTSLGRSEGFSLTKCLFDNLTPLFFCGGLGPGSS